MFSLEHESTLISDQSRTRLWKREREKKCTAPICKKNIQHMQLLSWNETNSWIYRVILYNFSGILEELAKGLFYNANQIVTSKAISQDASPLVSHAHSDVFTLMVPTQLQNCTNGQAHPTGPRSPSTKLDFKNVDVKVFLHVKNTV